MHAWTDGYEISEVNKSKTKKKNRSHVFIDRSRARMPATGKNNEESCCVPVVAISFFTKKKKKKKKERDVTQYRRRGSNPGPQAFATRNLRMRLGARTPRFARIYFFGPDIHRETSYIKRLALYQLSYVG